MSLKVDLSNKNKKQLTERDVNSSCETLLAAHNDISQFPLLQLDSLTNLDLSDNSLTSLPENIDSLLPCLSVLDVRGNTLEWLPSSLGSLPSLRILDVSYNHLHALPASLSELPSLTDLRVSGNPLSSFPLDLIEPLAGTSQIIEYLRNLSIITPRRTCTRVLAISTQATNKSAIIESLSSKCTRLEEKQQQQQQQQQNLTQSRGKHVVVTQLSKGLPRDLDVYDFDNDSQNIGATQLFFGRGVVYIIFVTIDPSTDPECKSAEFSASTLASQIRFAENNLGSVFPTTIIVGTHSQTLAHSEAALLVDALVAKLSNAFPRVVHDGDNSTSAGPCYIGIAVEKSGRDVSSLIQGLSEVASRCGPNTEEIPGYSEAVIRFCKKHCETVPEDRVVSETAFLSWSNILGLDKQTMLDVANLLCSSGKFSTFDGINPKFLFLEPHSLADVVFSLEPLETDAGCFAKIKDLLESWKGWGFPESNPFATILQDKGIAPVVPSSHGDQGDDSQILVSWKIPPEPPKHIGSLWPIAPPTDVKQYGRDYLIEKQIPLSLFSQVLVELRAFKRFSVQCCWKHGALVTAESKHGGPVQALYTSHLQVLNRRQTIRMQARFPLSCTTSQTAVWLRLLNEVVESALEHAGCNKVKRFARCPHCTDKSRIFLFPIEEVVKAAVVGRESLCNGSINAKVPPSLIAPDVALSDMPCDKAPGRYTRSIVFSPEDEVPGSLSEMASLQRHLNLMSRIQHPRIAKARSVLLAPLALLMEGSIFGTLRGFMFQQDHRPLGDLLSWRSRVHIAIDIATAMQCLHEHGISHPLLCSSSILVFPADDWGLTLRAKLAGFGPKICGNKAVSECNFWSSLMKEQGNPMFDVFLYGILLWELFLMREAVPTVEEKAKTAKTEEVIEVLRQFLKSGMGDFVSSTSHQDTAMILGNIAWKSLRSEASKRESFDKILFALGQKPIPATELSSTSSPSSNQQQQQKQKQQSILEPHQSTFNLSQQKLPSPPNSAVLQRSPSLIQATSPPIPAMPLPHRPSLPTISLPPPQQQSLLTAQKRPSQSTLVPPQISSPTNQQQGQGTPKMPTPPTSTIQTQPLLPPKVPSPTGMQMQQQAQQQIPSGTGFDITSLVAFNGNGTPFSSALVPDKETLWLGSGQTITVLSTTNFAVETILSAYRSPQGTDPEILKACYVVALIEHGNVIYSITSTGAIRCWQKQKMSILHSIQIFPPTAFECAVLVPRGEGVTSTRIWCGSSAPYSCIAVIDAPSMSVIRICDGVGASCFHYSPKTDVVYAGAPGELTAIGSWDCKTKARAMIPGMRPLSLIALAGKLWCGTVGALYVFNAFTLEQEAEMPKYEQVKSLVSFSCGSNVYIAAGGLVISIWSPDKMQCIRELDTEANVSNVRSLSIANGLLVPTTADGSVLALRGSDPFIPMLVAEERNYQHRSQYVHWMALAAEFNEQRVLEMLDGISKFRHMFEDPMLFMFGTNTDMEKPEQKEKLFVYVCAERMVDMLLGSILLSMLTPRPDILKDAKMCIMSSAPGDPILVPPPKLQLGLRDPIFDVGKAMGESAMRVHKEHIKCLTLRGAEVLAECVVRRFSEWLWKSPDEKIALKAIRPAMEEALAKTVISDPIQIENLIGGAWTDKNLFQDSALYDGQSLFTTSSYNADLPPRMGTREQAFHFGYKQLTK